MSDLRDAGQVDLAASVGLAEGELRQFYSKAVEFPILIRQKNVREAEAKALLESWVVRLQSCKMTSTAEPHDVVTPLAD